MRVGDVGGLGEIYDDKGELILEPGEIIHRKIENDDINAWKGKHALTGKTLLGYSKEKGTLYLTDRRLVFIRIPDPWLAFKTHGTPFELSAGLGDALYSRDLQKLGLNAFLELHYSEVRSFRSKKGRWAELRLKDANGLPVRVDVSRRGKEDDKIPLLEQLLRNAGVRKLNQ